MGILFNAHLNVLVAEDNPDDVFLIKVAFQKATHSTTLRIVADGEEAVAYLEGKVPYDDRAKFPVPNLILSDLKMPRMDGFELIKWVRTHPLRSAIPIVMLSSSSQPADVRKAYKLGVNSFLVKPPTLDELVRLIRVTFEYWSICESPDGQDEPPRSATGS